MAKEFQKNRIPLIFVLISHGPENRRDSYIGNPIPEGEFEKLASCATNTGAPVVRADREFSFKEELFWKNDWHLNPEGEKIFADYLTGKIFKLAP